MPTTDTPAPPPSLDALVSEHYAATAEGDRRRLLERAAARFTQDPEMDRQLATQDRVGDQVYRGDLSLAQYRDARDAHVELTALKAKENAR